VKDTEGKFYTLEEYQTLIKDAQTDKDGKLVYLYAADREAHYTYIDSAHAKGYNVLLMDGQLDTPLVQMLERKLEKTTFTRVDSDVIDRLIQKDEPKGEELSAERSANLSAVFETQLPKTDKTTYHVETQPMGEEAMPVVITQSEYMRRMKDMARIQPGMGFYGEMPDMYSLVLNTDNRLIKEVLEQSEQATEEALKPIEAELRGLNARKAVLQAEQDKKKYDEITEDERKDMEQCRADIETQEGKRREVLGEYAKGNERVHQLIDLALLQNGLLTGEALTRFVKRSVELL
jgi:molecular chaperone HtpG